MRELGSTQPTAVELEILRILWELEPCPVREIHTRLAEAKGTNYSTTVKMLSVMLQKGLVARNENVTPHLYRSVLTRQKAAKTFLRELIDKVYDGSSMSLVLQALAGGEGLERRDRRSPQAARRDGGPGMNSLLLIRELASDVLVERLGWVLVHSLWQFTLIAFAAAIVVRLLGRGRAAARYTVLVGAMAAIVVSPMATWCLQPEGAAIAEAAPDVAEAPIATAVAPAAARLSALDGDTADAARTVDLPAEELPARSVWRDVPEVAATDPAPLSWAEAAERTLQPWLAWIVVGWSLGVVLCSLRPLLGWHALLRLRRVGVSPVGEEISAALRRVAGQLGLRRAVQVLQSTLVQTPVLVGYFRPAILLPVGLATGLPISQLEAILAHELAHVRRHDFVVNLLQTLVETLCFYHPAVWWLSWQIRVEREHCCDDLVVGLLGNRVEYGRALLAVEELRGTSSVLALGMADGVLLSRVRRLFGGDRAAARFTDRWPAALLSLAGVGFVLVLGLVWHRAAVDDGERPSTPVIATLPGDITVELVGVSFHPSKDKAWWRPDGRSLEPRPELEGGFSVMSGSPEQAQCREFLIHIRGLPREHAVTTDYGPVSAATGSSYSNGLWVGEHGAGPFKSDTTSVRVGLTTEPYGPTVEIDITGTRQPAELSADLQPFYDRIVPLRVEEVDGQTELILDGKASNNLFKEAAWELHAVDVDGAKHRRSSESVTRSGERHFTFKLPRNRIARFEYRVRPYRHWATFENVSLESGMKTEVKVSTESQPAPKPERYSAMLPDGVTVSFVGITKNMAPARTGWRPDGLPLGDVPEWPEGLAAYGGNVMGTSVRNNVPIDANGRDFLWNFQGLRRQPSLIFELPCKDTGYPNLPVTEPYRLRVSGRLAEASTSGGVTFRPPAAVDEVRVGLSDEPWGKWLQIGPIGEPLNSLDAADLYQSSYAQILPQRAVASVNDSSRPVLRLQQHQRYHRLYDLSVRTFDTEGLEQLVLFGGSETVEGTDFVDAKWRLVRPLPAGKELARFEYRLRPYRHWVTFKGVSLEPGKESDVRVSVETVQATADFPRPRPEDVRGLDLSRAAVRHYSEATRLSPEQQTPELLVPGSDPAEPWRRPKNVFLMPLAQNIWLKYPAGSGHFYINHRPDGTWQHERMYGPIEGDPFELLKLEVLFREQLKPGATGGDPRYRLTLMFRTGEPELIRRAWKLAEPELSATGVDEYFTEQDPQRYVRLEVLQRIREALRDEAEAFRRPELTDVAARMREIVAAAEAAIDATNDAVADTAYESVTYLQPGLKAKIPEALWGPPLDGLRLGLVPSDGIDWSKWQQLPTDKPLPTHITALSGDELQYLVVVENVSDREIKLSGYVVGQEMARGLEMLDQHGRPVDIENLHASTLHIRSYWRLKPGERQLLTMPAVNLTSAPVDPAKRRLGYSVKAAPGHHTLQCTIRFGNLDNERHRYVPGKSEWIGELSTGTQKITVAERVLDAGEDPAADQSVSLVDAVRDFNAENTQRGRGQEQPPLTEEEVVAAIQRSDWKRDTKDVSEREFAAFKAVAKTRRLPEGAKLEVLTGVQSDAFTTSQLWSIRLIMPALERAGTVGFSIRHTVLGEEKIDPQQVAWGRPDADGLSLGLFLSPRKAQYQIGERVQLRLFVRNEGRKAIDDLTFMNITWPVIEDFTVTDQTGARVAVRNGHEEWSGLPWIAGAIRSRLEAGEAYALRVPFEIRIGGEVDKLVGRILDAKPGQTLRLRVRAANGSERIRAADEPKPESGEVTLAVQTETAAVDDAKNPSNRHAALPRATLTGRFVYDGEAPPRKDVWPQFAEIDATRPQPPGPDGRFSGVEATYREFLKQNIRPSTLDSSLLVDKSGGVANVVIWVTSREIPWTPPADLAQRPATIRLQDGNFSPRMTVATVGQPVVVENLDPVSFNFHAEFSRALNSPVNMLMPARSDEQPPPISFRAAEPYPSRFRSDLGPWAGGLLMIHGNPYVAVSQPDGSFTLPDLPPGEWEFRVWHERAGYVRHWPQGQFKRVIAPGGNDLGTIVFKPEVFGVKVAVTGPPPIKREQIGEVGGKPVFRNEVTEETLHSVFLGAALERYREVHRSEIAPTETEIQLAGEYFDRKHRERLEAAGGEAKLREQMRTIETQLAAPGLPEEDQKQLELEHLRLRSQLRPPSEDQFAEFMLRNWKLQKHLYENYGEGRILWQQAGLEAFDAMRRWMEAQEQAGAFKITDAGLRAKLYEYWTRDHGPFLTADKERIRKEFLEPEWLAPAAAKESPSAD